MNQAKGEILVMRWMGGWNYYDLLICPDDVLAVIVGQMREGIDGGQ